jgi:hypothetical protein
MGSTRRCIAGTAVITTIVISGTIACKRSTPPPVETPASAMIPVGTVKDVMKGIIDPTSSVLWNSVGVESGPAGLIDRSPKNDEEWAVVQNNALSLAEAANLLEMPGRKMSKPEEANSKGTPDAPELTPAQIEEKVNKDRAAWNGKADALRQSASKALAFARAHDKDGLLAVGEEIDNACESCHKVYWYPDQVAPKQ